MVSTLFPLIPDEDPEGGEANERVDLDQGDDALDDDEGDGAQAAQ